MRKIATVFFISTMSLFFLVGCSDDDPTPPKVTTSSVVDISQNTVTGRGIVESQGGSEVTVRGLCWSVNAEPTTSDSKIEVGAGIGSFFGTLTQLTAGTTYYVRAYATNAQGTGYGQSVSFTTLGAVTPTVTTSAPANVTLTTASAGGEIAVDGGASITARGVCWSTSPNPTTADNKTVDGTGSGSFTSAITSLTQSTTYYVRAYATNSAGTGYGDAIAFTTSFADVDGNVYNTVHIGSQVWMKENLRTTRYANGEAIPTTSPATLNIAGQADLKYQWDYNGQSSNAATYGKLYTWYVVADDRKLCPAGWHVPSDDEWTALGVALGAQQNPVGGKLKEAGTSHWQTPNTEATNESGFTALPGGFRYGSGTFTLMGTRGTFWSSTALDGATSWYRILSHDDVFFRRDWTTKENGRSVRCLKD